MSGFVPYSVCSWCVFFCLSLSLTAAAKVEVNTVSEKVEGEKKKEKEGKKAPKEGKGEEKKGESEEGKGEKEGGAKKPAKK